MLVNGPDINPNPAPQDLFENPRTLVEFVKERVVEGRNMVFPTFAIKPQEELEKTAIPDSEAKEAAVFGINATHDDLSKPLFQAYTIYHLSDAARIYSLFLQDMRTLQFGVVSIEKALDGDAFNGTFKNHSGGILRKSGQEAQELYQYIGDLHQPAEKLAF